MGGESVLPRLGTSLGSRVRFATAALALAVLALVAATAASGQPGQVYVSAVAVQPDGKIVAAGFRDVGDGNLAFALVRYLAGGVLDPSFGVGGLVVTDFTPGEDLVRGLALQSDGKIVVAGHSNLGTGSSSFRSLGTTRTAASTELSGMVARSRRASAGSRMRPMTS